MWRGLSRSLFCLCFLSACSSDPTISTRRLDVSPVLGANLDNPVPLDLVLVFEKDALAQVATLSAAQWQAQREQLALAFPTGIKASPFEVAPGQGPMNYVLERSDTKAIGAFVFADYVTTGAHRARIDRMEAVLVQLGPRAFSVAAGS